MGIAEQIDTITDKVTELERRKQVITDEINCLRIGLDRLDDGIDIYNSPSALANDVRSIMRGGSLCS